MKLSDIQKLPTELDGVPQSKLRSTAILNQVLEMIQREDSKETIFQVVELLNQN